MPIPDHIYLRVVRRDGTAVVVDVSVSELAMPGSDESLRQDALGPPVSKLVVASRAALLAYLADVTRFEAAEGSVEVQALEPEARRMLTWLGVTGVVPRPVNVELPRDA